MWEVSGLPLPRLIDRLIDLALEEHRQRASLKVTYHLQITADLIAGTEGPRYGMDARLVIATTNPAKLAEYRLLLAGYPLQLVSLREWESRQQPAETGATFT